VWYNPPWLIALGDFFMRLCSIDSCGRKHEGHGYCAMHLTRLKKYSSSSGGKKNQASLEERFWRFVTPLKTDECWVWQGQKLANKYGRISLGSKSLGSDGAHRVSWMIHNKQDIPKGLVVMHSCDNPSCVNPKHLSIGTPKENHDDMVSKGRKVISVPVGEHNGKSKITANIARQIREYKGNHAETARIFNVSVGCVRSVRSFRTWKHI